MRYSHFNLRDVFRGFVEVGAVAFICGFLLAIPAQAEQRVALVIGNSDYSEVPMLPNPVNDADAIGATFSRLGFDVTLRKNLNKSTMERDLAEFSDKAAAAELAVVYFAGHGMEMDGRNYLIPVDARLKSDNHIKFETVSLDDVLDAIDGAKTLKLVLLDACRDNPFTNNIKRSVGTRSIGRGLAKVESRPGTLVSYAAAAGTTAWDGKGNHSPYTEALLASLEEPGLELSLMFRKIADHVQTATNGNQTPFEYGRLPGMSIYLKEAAAEPEKSVERNDTAVSNSDGDNCRDAGLHWAAIKDEQNIIFFEDHLKRFGNCSFSTLAQAHLDEARKAEAEKLASLQPSTLTSKASDLNGDAARVDTVALSRSIQVELRRLGCLAGDADGVWGRRSEQALERFNTEAKRNLTTFDATEEALKLVTETEGRACTPQCASGEKLRNGQCVAIKATPTPRNNKKFVRQREQNGDQTVKRKKREVAVENRRKKDPYKKYNDQWACTYLCD